MKKYLLIISFLLSFFGSIYASHISGASISYRHLGNQKYEVSVKVSTTCASTSISPINVDIRCNSGSFNASLAAISVKDITGIPSNCSMQSKCKSNFNYYKYGQEEVTFKGIVDLSILTCCQVTISWKQSFSRSSALTNGQANLTFYTEAIIDKCVGSSIEWTDFPPPFVLTVGKDQILNFSANDSITNDSIVYKLTEPLEGAGWKLNYTGSFKADKPLSFLGFPYTSLNTPAGFKLTQQGNIFFRPTKSNEASMICVEATAWRKINGIMTKVGITRNEQMVIVEALGGSATSPYQKSPDVFKACMGDTSVAIIELTNLNSGTNCEINLKHNLRWAKAELLQSTGVSSLAAVFFIADSVTSGLKTNAFTLEVKDDACPVMGRTVKTYGIEEGGVTFTDSSQIKKSINCGSLLFWATNTHTGSNYKYSWFIDGKFTTSQLTGNTIKVEANDTGWIKATLYATSTLSCNYFSYTDSIYINASDFVRVKAVGGGTTCFGASVNVSALPQFGKAPFTYNWSTGQQGQTITITPVTGKNDYNVEITDSNGCKANDGVSIINYNPSITISGVDMVCPNKPFSISASTTYASSLPTFGWNGKSDNNGMLSDSIAASTNYTFSINDGGCIATKSWQVDISKPQAQFSYPDSVCIGDSLRLKANPFGGKSPYTVFWNSYNRYGDNIAISTKGAAAGKNYFFATITDNLGCTGTSNDDFTLVSPPIITLSPVPPICQSSSPISLTQYSSPVGGIWGGANINNNQLNPQTASKGVQQLEYTYVDPATQCSSKSTTQTKIYSPPQIDFMADSTEIYQGSLVIFTNTTQADTITQNRWELLGTPVTYTTLNAVHIFKDTGKYSVKLWVNDSVCPPDSLVKTDYIQVKSKTNVSVNEVEIGEVTIYPNPANTVFNIKSNKNIKTIEVYNSIGMKIAEQTANTNADVHFDVSNWSSGLYFIGLYTQEGKHWMSPIFIRH